MECKHERIKSVNCALFCLVCGVELPEGFVPGKAEEPAGTPKEPEKSTPTVTKKRTTKKGGK